MGEIDEDDRVRGLPRDLMQDIKRAAYEAKVCEMEEREAARRGTDKGRSDARP